MLPYPVLTGGPNDVQIKMNKTAHFECLFTASPAYALCKWQKDDDLLTASQKYQFLAVPHNDPINPNTVTCSLHVLNVSINDVGKYYCIAYYNRTYGFPVEHRVWSNPGQAKLKLAGKNSCTAVHQNYIYMCMLIVGTGRTSSNNSSASTSDKTSNNVKVAGGVGGSSALIAIITIIGVIIEVARRKGFFRRCGKRHLDPG